jgi:uncharacterized protein
MRILKRIIILIISALFFYLCVAFLQRIAIFLLAYNSRNNLIDINVMSFCVGKLFQCVYVILFLIIIIRILKIEFKDLYLNYFPKHLYLVFGHFFLGLLLSSLFLIITFIFGYRLFLQIDGLEDLINILLIQIVMFISCVTEELLFRGFLFYFLSRYINTISSMIINSIIFSILHIDFYERALDINLYKFIIGFLFSIILFRIVIKTKSLINSILFHFGWNIIFFNLFNPSNYIYYVISIMHVDDRKTMLSLQILMFFLLIIFILLYEKYLKINTNEETELYDI